jgi:hypothetical protein
MTMDEVYLIYCSFYHNNDISIVELIPHSQLDLRYIWNLSITDIKFDSIIQESPTSIPSMSQPPDFLTATLGPARPGPLLSPDDQSRPYVTLTFAQSLDGKIAGEGGKQLILSGRESMIMTHWCAKIGLSVERHSNVLVKDKDEDYAWCYPGWNRDCSEWWSSAE